MNKAGFLFFGAVMSLGSLFLASTGCGDDTEVGGGGSATTATSTSTTKAASSTSTSASSSSSGGGVKLVCDSYCTQVQTNCKDTNAQWPDAASCKAGCATFTAGALTDMGGNTLGCRIYHSGGPAAMTPATHCAHAGITAGDVDATATGMGKDGACGDGVEAFCKMAVATCPAVWADAAKCSTDATKFLGSAAAFGGVTDVDKNTFACRAYHLTVAAQSTANAMTHCPHIALVSEKCKN